VKIRIHIERLNLDGVNFTPAERRSLAISLESELSRLVAAGGISDALRSGTAIPAIPAASVSLGQSFTASEAGIGIAQALYAGFGNPGPEGEER
jgi:hypothetical protein